MRRVPVTEQASEEYAKNFRGVYLGYTEEEARTEASRYLSYKNLRCVAGCPISINISVFLQQVIAGQEAEAAGIIAESSVPPAVCGRTCPQETQYEGVCIRGIKGEPVVIDKLGHYVADWAHEHKLEPENRSEKNGQHVAVVGAGSAGLTYMGDLAKFGYEIKILEALRGPSGVLIYGIPEFRLPKDMAITHEVENAKKLDMEIETSMIVGKSVSVDDLLDKERCDAVPIGPGVGLSMFMHIPGETVSGVFLTNEFLTRNNLMKTFRENYDTPIFTGKRAIVVGGGGVAVDAVRAALHPGAETHIAYRRSEAELPAHAEEVHHAKEEGVISDLLTNPVGILQNENDWVHGVRVIRMELGEPGQSGRRRPVKVLGPEEEIPADTIIVAPGASPNPLFSSATEGLETNRKDCLIADEKNGQTMRGGVLAGGGAVIDAITVILTVEVGKQVACGINEYPRSKRA